MKTKILHMFLMFVIILGITSSSYATTLNNADYTILNNIKAINKIEIRGNVELFISDNPTEQVKVYNKYYSESALVQSSNGVLRITSYNTEKLIVWVTSENLRSISAYDNAEVNSFGDVSKIEFILDLHNNASAKLNFNSYSANITLRDHSKIELSGNVDEFSINSSAGAIIVKPNFTAIHYMDSKMIKLSEARKDDLAGLE